MRTSQGQTGLMPQRNQNSGKMFVEVQISQLQVVRAGQLGRTALKIPKVQHMSQKLDCEVSESKTYGSYGTPGILYHISEQRLSKM